MFTLNGGTQFNRSVTDVVLEVCAEHDLVVAPHVAAVLGAALGSDVETLVQVTHVLSAAQLSGNVVLPDPLPLVPALAAALDASHGTETLSARDRHMLLIAAICVENRTDVLLHAADITMIDLLGTRVTDFLALVAGHFSLIDPRVRIWVHGAASLAERTAAHHALASAYDACGGRLLATWHRSLATLEGNADFVPDLLALASRADDAGHCSWAFAVAREAASHARPIGAARAHLLAGRSALGAGCAEDAVDNLTRARTLADSDPLIAARALPLFVHAESLRRDDVPDQSLRADSQRLIDAARDKSDDDRTTIVRYVAKALTLAACLLAAQGAVVRSLALLEQVEGLAAEYHLPRADLCTAKAWCAVFAGTTVGTAFAPGPCWCGGCSVSDDHVSETRVIAEALTLGMSDDAAGGLRLLHTYWGDGGAATDLRDEGPVARQRSPLTRAYRSSITALLHFWSGEVAQAAREIGKSAYRVPVGVPLFGLGVVLAARLDVATVGTVGPVATALEFSHPSSGSRSIRMGDLVDQALVAYLDGRIDESVALGRLAAQPSGGGKAIWMCVPGFDELDQWPSVKAPMATYRTAVEPYLPSGHRRAYAARAALYTTDAERFAADYRFAAEVSWALPSAYDRARTEFVLGLACATHGVHDGVRRHLVVAAQLFEEAGAGAWQRAVELALRDYPGDEPTSVLAAHSLRGLVEPALVRAAPSPPSSTTADPQAPGFIADLKRSYDDDSGVVQAAGEGGPLAACFVKWRQVLTERELEVARHVVDGASNRETARRLHVSVRTIEVHVARVFSKLGVHSRVELSILAHRTGTDWAQTAT